MKRLLLSLALLGWVTVAFAQTPNPITPGYQVCNTSDPGNTHCSWQPVDDTHPLPVTAGGSGGTVNVQGNIADGATDGGNSVKIGGLVNTTSPTALTTGQRAPWWMGGRGSGAVFQTSQTGSVVVDVATATVDAVSTGVGAPAERSLAYKFNGASFDRDFTCSNSAVVNVTAGNTTEIVALTASQVIRVCSIAVSMSVAGTAQVVYGTGTNCGTGTTNLTGAMPLALGTPLAMSSGNGSLFRTASANALCVAAATGNVVGFVTYAKY